MQNKHQHLFSYFDGPTLSNTGGGGGGGGWLGQMPNFFCFFLAKAPLSQRYPRHFSYLSIKQNITLGHGQAGLVHCQEYASSLL